ncbi:restriction endonuclease subunit S [Mycoplasmopsis canis]|nr:restriction endonuclease subunit S [Mycoplasmopsis cynos]WQQ13240.1 restriction endonuclease subunit S [Mycoplasmopsis cynos]
MIVGKNLAILPTTLTKMTNVWEQERLGNLSDIKSGDFVIKIKQSPIFKFPVYNGGTTYTGFYNKFNFLGPKVIMSSRGAGAGTINYVKSNFWAGNSVFVLDFTKDKMVNLFFSYILLKNLEFKIRSMISSTGIPALSVKDVCKIKLFLCNLNEQQRIGNIFSLINSLITLHQRELKILKIFKKSLFVKMIVGKNLTILLATLTKMTNVWEQERLGNLYQFGKSGGTPLSSNKEFYNGHIPFLSITDISNSDTYIYKTEKNITLKGLKNSSAWIVPKDSISLAMYASIGKVAILKNNVSTSQAIFNMVFSDELNLRDFIFYALKRMELLKLWNSLSSSGTQSNLTSEIIKNYKITLTKNFSERHKINKLFNKIYSLITLHQREDSQSLNQGCLVILIVDIGKLHLCILVFYLLS